MTGIVIYVEGGGDSASGRAQLRQGFDVLLEPQKNAARARKMSWKLIPCGGRNATFDAFQHAAGTAESEIIVLLVDAEEPVATSTPTGRATHLAKRDGWGLDGVAAEQVHLMTQCMEAWIVADADTLAAFYGKDFHRGALRSGMYWTTNPRSRCTPPSRQRRRPRRRAATVRSSTRASF